MCHFLCIRNIVKCTYCPRSHEFSLQTSNVNLVTFALITDSICGRANFNFFINSDGLTKDPSVLLRTERSISTDGMVSLMMASLMVLLFAFSSSPRRTRRTPEVAADGDEE